MNEKLQNIINEINNGTRKYIYGLNLTKEDFLTKDSNGIYFIEYLLKNDISISYERYGLENNIIIAYLICKYEHSLYFYNLDEETLFSNINGVRLIDYILEKDKINDDIVKTITNNIEIIDLIIKYNNIHYLDYISDDIKNKLIEKDVSGSYLIEKYLDNPKVLDKLIPFINDTNILLEICNKNNNYDLMKYANINVLMSKFNDSTILEYLTKNKNIIPNKLERVPDNKEFINFLIDNNYHDYLLNTSENTFLTEISSSKTLLEYLIEKGYSPRIGLVFKEETIAILDKYNKLNFIENISKSLLLKKYQSTNNDETILEYLIDKNYDLTKSILYNRDENIVKILYKKDRADLLAHSVIEVLLKPVNKDSTYTYFDYILDSIKNNKIKANIISLSYGVRDVAIITKYYLALADHDMIKYVDDLNKDALLKKYGNTTLLEELLNINSNLTLNKIIKNKVKADPEIAFIIKSKGFEQENINVSQEENNFAKEYLDSIINHTGIGPLYEEGEVLLNELKVLFTSDGKSDNDLIDALVSGYREALITDYNTNIQELRNLIEIKKKNIYHFYYIKKSNSGYFSKINGSVFCDNNIIDTIMHETGHALHYYLVDDKVPDNYKEVIDRARKDPNLLVRAEDIANKYRTIKDKIISLVEKKYDNTFKDYYTEDKRQEINTSLIKSKEEKKKEYKDLNIPEEQLDIILNEMYTTEEYINHQKRIFIEEEADAISRNEFATIMATCDILDAIYEGKLHSGILTNTTGDKIKPTSGHGLSYYYESSHGFDEMIANFASMSKSKKAKENLLLFKNVVGDEIYNMISDFYYKNIVYVSNEELDVNNTKKGR